VIPDATEGRPEPLGATPDEAGTNFAVHSANATAVEVCLFEASGAEQRVLLRARTGDVWHGHIEGIAAGTHYGLRAYGPFAPEHGHRFDPSKLLLDPFATAIDRGFSLHPALFTHGEDSAAMMPRAIVDTPDDSLHAAANFVPWDRTIIYELHVRGFTHLHPEVPEVQRGTFAALAHPAVIDHLRTLGVTAIEVMPSAAWIDERHLAPLGLHNYWGYNPVGWMVPDARLAPGGWAEIRVAVAALAAAGIETILDVVLNHSGEGDALGPTLSLRGLDNATYYRLRVSDPAQYVNDTGTGNTLALDRPAGLRLVMDTLRTWARRTGLHGFRFDLGATLGRRDTGFDPNAPLLQAIAQDPELRRLKLIMEPWDLGHGGWRTGAFPAAFAEWNDRFRDGVRRCWRGAPDTLGDLGTRLAGSDDIFRTKHRPSRSINYIVSHDGFTLADLVSHEHKHNEANGEGDRDGTGDNHSWNNGVEGASNDPAVIAARKRDERALLTLLLLARGTPMLAMGAEFGHSQRGNNNAYAQDNEISWLDWSRMDKGLVAFTRRLIALRQRKPALHADSFLVGTPLDESGVPDVTWTRADGKPMHDADWTGEAAALVACFTRGEDRAAIAINRGWAPVAMILPASRARRAWQVEVDSKAGMPPPVLDGVTLLVAPRSVIVLSEVNTPMDRNGSPDSSLDKLASVAGIAPEWWTIDGTRHTVSDDTKRALLAAMNLPAGTEGEARDSLAALARSHQLRTLPHVVVARLGESPRLPVVERSGALRFVLESEDGAQDVLHVDAEPESLLTPHAWDGTRLHRTIAQLPPLAEGRWRVWLEDRPETACAVTVAPPACYLPDVLAQGSKRFGLAAHLYSVSREGDQGIGDFTTLAQLGRATAQVGGALLGLNPLHMLFPDQRERASPYHPSDRRFIDPIYIDVSALDEPAGRAELAQHGAELAALSAATLVDYERVWAIKRAVLEAAYAAFDTNRGHADPMAEFLAYGGIALRRFAIFQAVAETRPGEAWQDWPQGLRDPAGAEVAAFAAAHPRHIGFHLWCQWLADTQLGAAASASGLQIGLYRDLAIGCAPDGAEAWAAGPLHVRGVSVGAPPDPFSTAGQIWYLPPPDPWAIRVDGYRGLGGLLGANMRHAGALRIDHAMGLARLFWVPAGGSGADGAYVHYPTADLLGELALQSRRAQCLIVGEDLGTVPEGFRETLAAADVFSYRVLWFERDGTGFLPAARYPSRAVACISTHDLPTLAGWRSGADIEERARLGLIADADNARRERAAERDQLAAAVGGEPNAEALHGFLAATPSQLVLGQLDDLAGETVALNLPGTDRERPNWRRRIAARIPGLPAMPAARHILDRLRVGRTG
jgi:glycogen operon protein